MGKKKFYAVKEGRETGIFRSWAECKKVITGYSGAEYKSFKDLETAKDYLNDFKSQEKEIDELNSDEMIAYVDGSHNQEIDYYSYGAICFYRDKKEEIADRGQEEKLLKMRNVGGEIMAAQKAMEKAVAEKIEKLYLYHDYEGIEKWCTGEWKTNREATKEYQDYYEAIKDQLEVEFIKVKAHSGNKYNEEVDALAKDALFNG